MYSAADIITLYSISIHALREEGDATAKELDAGGEISIHALREEGDAERSPGHRGQPISIHALREEGDLLWGDTVHRPNQFLSTPSARRATLAIVRDHECRGFLSTPSARRATRGRPGAYRTIRISIHALREEGDTEPRAGRAARGEFLSTPSARRATARSCTGRAAHRPFLSTPSARRATQKGHTERRRQAISIHALREEGDEKETACS